jgi:CRP-like cAMP-binding protein
VTPHVCQLTLAAGQTLLLDGRAHAAASPLQITSGILRVYLLAAAGQEITIGFLQAGDVCDVLALRRDWVGLEALTLVQIDRTARVKPLPDGTDLGTWTLELLMIRHHPDTERRLRALLALLVEKLGRRNGLWYELPIRLTHERLAELIGNTRVTVTKMFSRLRQAGLIMDQPSAGGPLVLRLAPELVETMLPAG